MTRPRLIAAYVLATLAFSALLALIGPRSIYEMQMYRVRHIMSAGKQGWASDASKIIHGMASRSRNPHSLADRLLAESDGSLAYEGMLLAYETRHPQLRTILTRHLTDTRWNWTLSTNDVEAQLMLDKLASSQPIPTSNPSRPTR